MKTIKLLSGRIILANRGIVGLAEEDDGWTVTEGYGETIEVKRTILVKAQAQCIEVEIGFTDVQRTP